ncbi:MAG: TAXI family TRAP transporter solute-binding subunit [Caldilineaceae bacterium]
MQKQPRLMLVLLLCFALLLSACASPGAAPAAPAAGDAGAAEAESAPAESAAPSGETVRQAFGGGPVGGAFQTFANAMSLIMADADPNLDIAAEGTGGSGANLRGVNAGDVQYGISYAGDVYLGAQGQLPEDENMYTDVRPIAALYGGVVHLVVSEASGIEKM